MVSTIGTGSILVDNSELRVGGDDEGIVIIGRTSGVLLSGFV